MGPRTAVSAARAGPPNSSVPPLSFRGKQSRERSVQKKIERHHERPDTGVRESTLNGISKVSFCGSLQIESLQS